MSEKLISYNNLSEYDEKIKTYIENHGGDSIDDTTVSTESTWSSNKIDSTKVDKVSGKGLSTNDFTDAYKTAVDNIPSSYAPTDAEKNTIVGIQKNGTDITIDANRKVNISVPTNLSDMTEDDTHRLVTDAEKTTWSGKADTATTLAGYGISDAYNKTEIDTALDDKVDTSLIGAANGIATLDENGIVPSSILPSYVDDVLEYENQSQFPTEGESGKIYVDLSTNLTYRWSGTTYVEISPSLALGETSSTAYAGDKGKANADAISELQTSVGNKQDTLETQTAYTSKGTSKKVPQITTNELGQVTDITEVDIEGGADEVFLTKAEYDALPESKLTDDKWYNITDADGESAELINDDKVDKNLTWSSEKISNELETAGVKINDSSTTSTTETWSVSKINSYKPDYSGNYIELPELSGGSAIKSMGYSEPKGSIIMGRANVLNSNPDSSIIMGDSNTVDYYCEGVIVAGYRNTARAGKNFLFGNNNSVGISPSVYGSCDYSMAVGTSNKLAYGSSGNTSNAFVGGGSCTVSGTATYSFTYGYDVANSGWGCIAVGKRNASITSSSMNSNTGHAFVVGAGSSSNAFSVQYSGVVKAKSTITASTTADYAEFFEWLDKNPNEEDRVGHFVTLDGDKIRIATSEDDYILGVVSGEPFVLGNGDCDIWNGAIMHDKFRRTMYEPAPKMAEVYDEDGNIIGYEEVEGEFEGKRFKLNPEWDPDRKYESRFDRPEWAAVGMLGVLPVLHDGTAKVNGYVTINDKGIATACEKSYVNSYRVIKENADDVVEIIFR